jgi:raffinose/stachyose/melibiose transport system substrate-binding protein
MKTRKHVLLAGLAVGALTLSACVPSSSSSSSGGDGGTAAPGEEVTLKVWSWQASTAPAWERIFDVYEDENPGITIEFEGFQPTEYNQILATGLEGSDGPDVPMLRAYGGVQSAIRAGQLVPIDDDVEGLDQFDPTVLRAAQGQDDGKTYGVPFAFQTLQMFYNKTMFDEMGLEEPTTWDEFVELQETLVAEGVTPMALGAREDWVLPIFHDIVGSARYGGTEFEKAVLAGEKDFTDPDYVASLEVVEQMREYLDPNVTAIAVADASLQFTSGQAAQWPGGSFDLPTFEKGAPDTEWGVYQVPPPPGSVSKKAVTPAYADGSFGINKESEHQEEALALLNWMATPEFGQLFADEAEQFSALPGVEYSNPLMQEMNELYADGPSSYLLLVNFRYGDPTGTGVLGPDIQSLFLGQKTPQDLATNLQTGVSTWFTPGS